MPIWFLHWNLLLEKILILLYLHSVLFKNGFWLISLMMPDFCLGLIAGGCAGDFVRRYISLKLFPILLFLMLMSRRVVLLSIHWFLLKSIHVEPHCLVEHFFFFRVKEMYGLWCESLCVPHRLNLRPTSVVRWCVEIVFRYFASNFRGFKELLNTIWNWWFVHYWAFTTFILFPSG